MQTSQTEQIMDEPDVYSELNQADMLCENDPRHYTRAQSLEILKERRDALRKVNTWCGGDRWQSSETQ